MRRLFRAVPVALLVSSLAALFLSRGGETVPLFAARTGLMCQNCHFDPNGGGPRNAFGFNYAKNRHSVEAETDSTSPWANLDLTNKIGETMPVYISVNQRFMLLDNNTKSIDGLDRLAFFNMESNLHFAFQPHEKLTLVYSRDAFGVSRDAGAPARAQEAFGMIGGLPFGGYFRAGRFRVPFGLRLDDHTVATRNAFLDFSTGDTFLPYDPRDPDMGYEIGGASGGFFGRASFTNGSANVFAPWSFAEAKAIKLGYNMAGYQGGVSFYDEFNHVPFAGLRRGTRWGYYGMTHFGPLTALGEVAAGTDQPWASDGAGGFDRGPKINRLAWFAEVDYTPIRWLNGRVRYDYFVANRASDPDIREANTHQRYAVEGEWLPVPFAELRATFRFIDHKGDETIDPLLEDETQGYLQFHFIY